MSAGLGYRADLDGLRAVAIVPVILYHLGVPGLPGGFVGVDVFFVLSGFFITRQIVHEADAGRFSLLGFYDRRIRRLFPALIVMLAVTAAMAMAVLPPHDLKRFGLTLAAAVASASNFVFWSKSGYFAPEAESEPLLHTWSLAVEEQFYIGFPLLLMLVWRHGRRRLCYVIACIGAISLALSASGTTLFPKAAFYLLPTRAWELALGCLLALSLLPVTASRWLQSAAALLGLAAIAFAVLTYNEDVPFPGLAALVPCLGCALVIWAGLGSADAAAPKPTPTLPARLLVLRPVVFIGLISYSLYLWHWPIIVFANQLSIDPLDGWDRGLIAIAILAAAIVSWKLIEQPFRGGRRFWPSPAHRFTLSGAGVAIVVAAGLTAYVAGGFPQWLPTDALALSRQVDDRSPKREECHAAGDGTIEFSQTCVVGRQGARRVVVFADSHGAELSYALFETAQENGLRVRQVTASACAPSLDFDARRRPGCAKHVAKMLAALERKPGATVIMTAYYSELAQDPAKAEDFWRGYENSAAALRASGHEVIILGDVPPHPVGRVPDALVKWRKLGRAPETYAFQIDAALAGRIDERLRDIAARSGARYVPLLPYVCGGKERCHGYARGHAIYFDRHHLSVVTARSVVNDILLPALTVQTGALPSASRETGPAPEPSP